MPGPGTSFTAPIMAGTRPQASPTTPNINDYGNTILEQDVTLVANSGTAAISGTLYVPIGSKLSDVIVDTTVAFNTGGTTVAVVASLGFASGGTQIASGVDVTSTGRVRPTFTATQLTNMGSIASPAALVATITQSGTSITAATTGAAVMRVQYAPTVQSTTGNT